MCRNGYKENFPVSGQFPKVTPRKAEVTIFVFGPAGRGRAEGLSETKNRKEIVEVFK